VSDTNTEQDNFCDKAPVLTKKGFFTSLGIADALCTAYSEVLYEKYNRKKLGNNEYQHYLHRDRIEVLKRMKKDSFTMAKLVNGWEYYSDTKFATLHFLGASVR